MDAALFPSATHPAGPRGPLPTPCGPLAPDDARAAMVRGLARIVGSSPDVVAVKDQIARAGGCDLTVCIEGETGTGKDLIARAIHECSVRRARPLVVRDCSAIPDTLLESELFGHVRGAFTDARHDRKGLFELADGGTIFLDEIANASMALQRKLLRVLQDREFVPIGGSTPRRVNVRIVCATNVRLDRLVAQNCFREDLFYRLYVFSIRVPPLRDRAGDVLLLADTFLRDIARELDRPVEGLAPCATAALVRYAFPGNVRELKNEIERAVASMADGERWVRAPHFSERLVGGGRPAPPAATPLAQDGGPLRDQLGRLEALIITHALAARRGNVTQTARSLGLTRRALVRKITKLGLRAREAPAPRANGPGEEP